ncbi:mechanosensitive ion channel family protein [Craterilacuibacter sinensis]|uniref:Small-conductance mechanosensitive channel n=1 Tax=Craterilacuibacter sinensis TaxID=2686017 RepID=A0A845BI37_9NEIS|nr:mechanosensitive ion channel family protein [Craterilacuibacter sinensis]MXR36407.1 mechanosensitive ion channel [Craterilacuibacter sinensis]
MPQVNWSHWTDIAVSIGLNILAAIALWIIGRWLINLACRLVSDQLIRRNIDATLQRYVHSFLSVSLTVILIIGILGYFGMQTTTFAAVIAAGGIAIGMAWSGLLANFAAGIFLVVLRPFKVGDFICAGGVTGTVENIGLFATTFNTPDNVQTLVGNNKIFSDNIQNYSTNGYRRVDLCAQLANSADYALAQTLLREKIATIANVMTTPPPDIEILEFNERGPVLAVRPYCHTDHYWQVYFDSNRAIRDTLTAAGFPLPEQPVVVRQG